VAETPLDYRLLALFVAVVEETSFSKAAHRLGVGKSSVSRGVARLEQRLGAELIHRSTHSVSVSTAGAALYERAAQHLAALDRAVRDVPERAQIPSGLLRITAPQDFGLILLPELVAQFSRRYPAISFEIRISNARLDLVAEGLDLAIRTAGTMKDSSLTARRLGDAGSALYAAPSYLARRGKPARLGDPRHEWLAHPAALARWKTPHKNAVRFLCDDFLVMRELVRDGAGIGLLPRFVAAAYVRDGLIESVPLASLPATEASLVLLYPSSGQLPRKVAVFRDFLVQRLKTPLA